MDGTPFGRYELVKRIGRGGMAEIFQARLRGPGGFEKDFAIKRLLPYWAENAEFVEMLVNEAKVLTHLVHPNIVHVYELGLEAGELYIAMEYVAGFNLKEFLRDCETRGEQLSPALSLYVAREVVKGLAYAHERKDPQGTPLKLVHRDVSPQNILVSEEGEVKLTDFGIAKALGRSSERTETGVLKGKCAYMSPEQAMGQDLDARSDLFSLGLVLFECLSGVRYFEGKNDLSVLEEIKNHDLENFPNSLMKRLPADLPDSLKTLLRRLLSRDKSGRFESAAILLKELESELSLALEGEDPRDRLSLRISSMVRESSQGQDAQISDDPQVTRMAEKTGKTLIFASDVEVVEDEATRLVEFVETPPQPPVDERINKPSLKPFILPFILLIGLGFSLFLFRQHPESSPISVPAPSLAPPLPPNALEEKLPTVIEEVPPVEVPPVVVEKKEEPPLIEEKPLPPPPPPAGKLLVSARPWAKVSIEGVGRDLETPVSRSLAPGRYAIKANYNGELLSGAVEVKSAKKSVCVADFSPGKKGFSCR